MLIAQGNIERKMPDTFFRESTVDFEAVAASSLTVLPVNSSSFHIKYCSDRLDN